MDDGVNRIGPKETLQRRYSHLARVLVGERDSSPAAPSLVAERPIEGRLPNLRVENPDVVSRHHYVVNIGVDTCHWEFETVHDSRSVYVGDNELTEYSSRLLLSFLPLRTSFVARRPSLSARERETGDT